MTTGLADTIRAIEQLKYRYLRAVDTKDWAALADTLTVDVRTDYGSKVGGRELSFADRDSVIAYFTATMGGTMVTEHRVDHPIIEVDGDEATGTWYLQDRVIVPDHDVMIEGAAFYRDCYRRTVGGWRIAATGYERTYELIGRLSAGDWKLKRGSALA